MGYGVMPYFDDEIEKGVSYCRDKCFHTDCEVTRKMRNTKCVVCRKGFKGGDQIYEYGKDKYVHAFCAWEEEEKDKEQYEEMLKVTSNEN